MIEGHGNRVLGADLGRAGEEKAGAARSVRQPSERQLEASLSLSEKTVANYQWSIKQKLAAATSAQMALIALERGVGAERLKTKPD